MNPANEARDLLAVHGRRAQQVVVDQVVAAVRHGDDGEAERLGHVLRALERAVATGDIASSRIAGIQPGNASGRDE